MESDRSNICGCKGIRSCLKCEKLFDIVKPDDYLSIKKNKVCYYYCSDCDKCWPGWEEQDHLNHTGEPFILNGIFLMNDFLSSEEELNILKAIDGLDWETSQSGRRKQNFGPKCNFKKKRIKLGAFKGFPESTKFIQEKFKEVDILKDFITIEQCTLEYDPNRGSSIDPHIDDCWIWGERVVTVNLLSDTILCLTGYCGNRYNLNILNSDQNLTNIIVRIPMTRRSLFVMTSDARYKWEHRIFREDITNRRICLAYREFTAPYLPGGVKSNEGDEIINAVKFW